MTTGTTIPLLVINITSPGDGAFFTGQSITVSGTARFVKENVIDGTSQDLTSQIDNVEVRLGNDLVKVPTKQNSSWANWSTTFTPAEVLARVVNGQVTIKAKATEAVTGGTLTDESVITITVDQTKPVLEIAPPPEVNKPAPPYKVTVEGTATDTPAGVQKVEWRVGNSGSFTQATNMSGNWSQWRATDIPLPPALGPYTITVKATDKVGNVETKTATITVIDGTPPDLNIASPSHGATVTLVNGKVSVAGTASDTQTGVALVEWALGGQQNQFTPVVPKTANDWSTWSALIPIPTFGEHTVTVRARDGAGNTKASIVTFGAAVTFEPKDPSDVVSPAVYLEDLLNFAALRVKTDASGPLVSRDLLMSTFYQPFNALTALNNRHVAHQPVHQVRLCIEVLRKVLASRGLNPSAAAKVNYRQTAYETLLRNLGTSYEELRLVGTDENKRTALANRLGIAPTPDQLDRLVLQPNEITAGNLEQRFGLVQTSDPLSLNTPPVTQEPELLTWQLATLRALWQQQDDAARSDVGTPVPVIDPDLIGDGDFRTPTPVDQAYSLWQERRQWVANELARITQLREAQATAMAGFNAIVGDILGPVDAPDNGFSALTVKYKAGDEIEPRLREKQLTLQPFLYLMRIGDLASTGTVLDTEWADVYSVLVQVQKFRQYKTWRQEEGTLTLGPDSFQMPLAETQPLEPPRWRATPQARQAWQATLEARINQKQTMVQALQAAVDDTEEVTLPLLRNALLEPLSQPNDTTLDAVANRLTRALAIDLQSSGKQKTTRMSQAIETLQTVLFSVRTGRFAETDPAANWELALNSDYEEADFDEEWQWMGTHATWRSAMFIFLHPDNLLLPTLRTHQTPAFRSLVSTLRSNRRLTLKQTRAIAQAYSEYYRDVCSMTLDASCQTLTRLAEQEQRALFYMFGLGSATGGVYWSAYDPQDTSDHAQTFWEVVPGLDKVDKVVGAVPYQISDTERFMYLFVHGQEKGKQKLSFTRYDLERLVWDTESTELELPEETGIDTIIAVQAQAETKPPELFLRSSRARYFRSLNMQGSEWQSGNSEVSEQEGSDDWSAFKVKEVGYPAGGTPVVKAIHAVLKTTNESPATYWLCMTKTDNKLYVEKWSNVLTGRTTVSSSTFNIVANFIGAFQWSAQDELLLFYSTSGGRFYRQIKINNAGTQQSAISSLDRVTPSYGLGTGEQRHLAYHRLGTAVLAGNYRCRFAFNAATGILSELGTARVAPSVNGPLEITEQLSETALKNRKGAIQAVFEANQPGLRSNLTYLEEAYYFVPVQLALQLQQQGQYTTALDWFQTVYAYNLPVDQSKIYYGLVLEGSLTNKFDRTDDWLLEGLNPHDIVTSTFTTRKHAYTRFTMMSLARCFLDFADAEFTRETPESIARARALYMAALELLDSPEMQDQSNGGGSTSPLPPNPVLQALHLRAELNLFKIRNELNIAGLERQFEPEAQPSEVISGLPTIGNGGQRITPGSVSLRPTPYRYAVLIERAKQLITVAQQMEAAFLAALEKRDAEAYTLLKARQDIQLSRAGVRLQDLRVKEAEGGVKLAELQQQRSQIQANHFQNLLNEGISGLELASLALLQYATNLQLAAAITSFVAATLPASVNPLGFSPQGSASAIASGLSTLAGAASTEASVLSTLASFERRRQEWELQQTLALQDARIGVRQVKLAEDHVRVVGQEHFIAEMQAEHAEATVDFLANKFTNYDLFDWMSGILERVYAYFLQQATAMAKLAERQLAFERQDIAPAFIRGDYWEAPTDGGLSNGADGNIPDRRGLTGSARLLQDIFQLDQYAFETNQRKLQLTRTISLAQLAPAEFQRFRDTGVMLFATPMELFDRDFPGHYLRLVKRVRTSVIALIPPTQGIRATLSTAGASRVVIGNPGFQVVVVNHGPQSVALSSPVNATGLFELDQQPEMLLPFEGIGADTLWELRLPRAANPFDYRTLADVLITIDYTALDSSTYRQQVIQQLRDSISGDRPFSFRQQFADQWYDLHNPDQTATPMTVRFQTVREDFPPNIEGLKIQQLVLYVAYAAEQSFEFEDIQLFFKEQGSTNPAGGAASSNDGIISTRRHNGTNWATAIITPGKSPIGEWELILPDKPEGRELFKNEQIEDILFVITYAGHTPAWPV